MQEIFIDEDFRTLLPPLSKDTYSALEENLIQNGCRDSLVLWNGTLVDGHNRYEICTRLDILFNTVNKEFDSKDEVLIWIITTQVARRNLTPIQLSNYRGLHYRTDKKITTNASGKNQHSPPGEVVYQNDTQPQTLATSGRLAKQYNVSRPTIMRDAKISEAIEAIGEASPEAKRMILSSEISFDKKDLQAMASATKDEIEEIATKIEEGTFEKKKPETTQPTIPLTPVDSIISGMQPLDKAIGKVTNTIATGLPNITKKADRTKLLKALRAYINTLEELYSTI